MRTVEWTKLLSNKLVLATGTVSAWSGIDVLDRDTRFLFSGGGKSLYRSIGQCLVYILQNTVAAATSRLWVRLGIESWVRAVASLTPMILSAFLWMLSS